MIERSQQEDVAIVRLTHGPANALDGELLEAFVSVLDDVESSDARAVILTGHDGVFSAGAHLVRVRDEGSGYVRRARPHAARAFERIFTYPLPVVAALNGHTIAGGCVIACAADHRVAAAGDYRIGLAELRVGLPFPAWALEIVRFALGPPHLQRLVLSARLLPPAEALTVGFVDEVVEPETLLARAHEVARRLASVPPATFRLTKRMLREPFAERARNSGTLDDEAAEIWSSPEARESVRRFVERTFGPQV